MPRLATALAAALLAAPAFADPLPGTKPLTDDGDLAAKMVEGIGKYLDRELAASPEGRKAHWKPDYSSQEAFRKSVEPNRQRLRKMLGVVDQRVPFTDIEYVGGPNSPSLVAETDDYTVHAIRWPVLTGVDGEGLLLEPKGPAKECVVVLPDADQTPEMLVGLAEGLPKESQNARRLAENGCRVVVPVLIDRKDDFSGNPKLGRMTNQPHREFVYRMAYEMGRHVIGYEVQKVLAAVDWLTKTKEPAPVGVLGYGEGGLLALYCGALDDRIRTTLVSGAFGRRERLIWQEPIYRNVFGLVREAGDAELGLLFAPDAWLILIHEPYPKVEGPPAPRSGRGGAAPGRLLFDPQAPTEDGRLHALRHSYNGKTEHIVSFTARAKRSPAGNLSGQYLGNKQTKPDGPIPADRRKDFDPAPRQKRQFDQLVAFTQKVWRDSDATRREFWKKADPSSPEAWEKSCEWYRDYFWEEVMGKLPEQTLLPNPRTRPLYDTPKWAGYEVQLDLYPDVFAYGILLLPKDLKPGEKRPVVVCQHGLEGRPQDVCDPKQRTKYYNSFGAQLADLGYIVYAPQNPYIGQDKFRVLQRKANPLKLSLFSFIIRQHETTLDWLATLPNVDADKMAFYGLSYGGKTAMRVPAVLKRYCLSICSADFNEWVGKNVSADFRGSYMFSGEYEMPEFDLGGTFNYAEMAYLIAPRPFMVERGHDDGVGIDEMVAYEYAKIRYLYANKLKIPDRTEIEWFAGGHEINGKGTFAFLKRHLGWPK